MALEDEKEPCSKVVVYKHIHSAGHSPRSSDHYSLPLMGRGGRKTTLQQKNILSFKWHWQLSPQSFHHNYAFLLWWLWSRGKQLGATAVNEGSKDMDCQKVRPTVRTPWFNFPLTSYFLSGLHFSAPQREMWLKLEFPLAGEAEKQENRGRGERRRLHSPEFTQAKHLLTHLYLPLIHLHPGSFSLQAATHSRKHTHIHKVTRREDRQN